MLYWTTDSGTSYTDTLGEVSGNTPPISPVFPGTGSYPSAVEVCNIALSKIGQFQITDIFLDSETERHCRLHLPIVRRSLLRRHAWCFATKTAELVESAVPGFGDWKRFDLPTDHLQTLALYEDEARGYRIDRFRREKQSIITPHSTVHLEYVADVADASLWDSDFLECVTLKLGSVLSIPLGQGPAKAQALLQELEQIALPQAQLNNAWEDGSGENHPTAQRIAQSGFVQASQYEI